MTTPSDEAGGGEPAKHLDAKRLQGMRLELPIAVSDDFKGWVSKMEDYPFYVLWSKYSF